MSNIVEVDSRIGPAITFTAPNATISSASPSVVTSTVNAGRVLQGALKFF